jgi:hypothetical protein
MVEVKVVLDSEPRMFAGVVLLVMLAPLTVRLNL